MTDKQWMKDAARAIWEDNKCYIGPGCVRLQDAVIRSRIILSVELLVEKIASIISKHCPENKAGKLVEVLIEVRESLGFPIDKSPHPHLWLKDALDPDRIRNTVKIIDSALDEYEKVKG